MRRIVLVLGCVAAVLLPACGDGGAKLAAYEIVSRAATTTVDSGRARFDMTMEASMGGMNVDVSADGVVDMAGQRMSMSMSVPGMPGGG